MSQEHQHPSDKPPADDVQPTAKEAFFFLTILSNMKNKPDVSLLSLSADSKNTSNYPTLDLFKSMHFSLFTHFQSSEHPTFVIRESWGLSFTNPARYDTFPEKCS
jgi:hypothetical protein